MHSNIIHIDVTDFPIAVERVVEPKLHFRPVAVAVATAAQPRILSASDEARQNGVYRGQSLAKALRFCHDLTVLQPNENLYRRASYAMIKVLSEFTPVLEPLRFGHAYLDMTGTRRLFGEVTDTAAKVQHEIHQRLHLGAAAGIAGNKLVSKVASDFITSRGERCGLHGVDRGEEEVFLAPLHIRFLPGVDQKIRQELQELNIQVNRELAAIPVEHLQMIFGRFGLLLHQRAKGIDPRPVQPPRRAAEIVEIDQLDDASNDYYLLQSRLLNALSRAAQRLRDKQLRCGRLRIQVQYSDYKENTAQQRFQPLDTDIELTPMAKSVLIHALTRRVRVRRMTLRLCDLAAAPKQLSLFNDKDARIDKITAALDKIRIKYGDNAIQFGQALSPVKNDDGAAKRFF
jgi:DNA polymerase-4